MPKPFEIKINGGGDWLFDDVYNNAQLLYKISPIPILFQFWFILVLVYPGENTKIHSFGFNKKNILVNWKVTLYIRHKSYSLLPYLIYIISWGHLR